MYWFSWSKHGRSQASLKKRYLRIWKTFLNYSTQKLCETFTWNNTKLARKYYLVFMIYFVNDRTVSFHLEWPVSWKDTKGGKLHLRKKLKVSQEFHLRPFLLIEIPPSNQVHNTTLQISCYHKNYKQNFYRDFYDLSNWLKAI